MTLDQRQISHLLSALCRGNIPLYIRGVAMASVIEVFPNIPTEVLAQITLTESKKKGQDYQTNAAFVVSAWLDSKREKEGQI